MKFFLLIVFILTIQSSGFTQDLGIYEAIVYKRPSGSWEPLSKSEYSVNDEVEKQTRFKWEKGNWQIESEVSRNFSMNNDTVEATVTYWNEGIVTKQFTRICYNKRDAQNIVVDVINDGVSKTESLNSYTGHVNLDVNEMCFRISYPFDDLMREAERLKAQGISLANRKLEFNMCTYEEFSVNSDRHNRVVSIESDITKVNFFYRGEIKQDSKIEANFKIFPNPFNAELAIEAARINGEKIEIIDSYGKEIFSENIKGKSVIRVNLSHIPSGLYSIILYSGNNVYSEKLIKI